LLQEIRPQLGLRSSVDWDSRRIRSNSSVLQVLSLCSPFVHIYDGPFVPLLRRHSRLPCPKSESKKNDSLICRAAPPIAAALRWWETISLVVHSSDYLSC